MKGLGTDWLLLVSPPENIETRELIDNLAMYVGKNGEHAMNQLKEDHKSDPNFKYVLSIIFLCPNPKGQTIILGNLIVRPFFSINLSVRNLVCTASPKTADGNFTETSQESHLS